MILSTNSAKGENLDLSQCTPNQNRFTLQIDNSFFPLPVGQQWVLVGEEDGETIGLQITVLNKREPLFKNMTNEVITFVVEESEWEDTNGDGLIGPNENLVEVSLNYFSQTKARSDISA